MYFVGFGKKDIGRFLSAQKKKSVGGEKKLAWM